VNLPSATAAVPSLPIQTPPAGLEAAAAPPQADPAARSASVARAADRPAVLVADTAKVPPVDMIRRAAEQISSYLANAGRELSVSVNTDNGQPIVRVVNPVSGELVRQIPGDEAIRIAKVIDFMQSMLVNQHA
jgi:flagellar protein FlaG